MSQLKEESITFGKYKDSTLSQLLRDRNYCEWLLKQEWFSKQYEFLYNKVKNYSPLKFFKTFQDLENKTYPVEDFLNKYPYFHLISVEEVKIPLTEIEKKCYTFYLQTIEKLKEKMYNKNTFDIKAPTSWLIKFEEECGIPRETFKEFINAYDLPNITTIVEDIKNAGGIKYLGAKSYIIAKEKSLEQEKYWEKILKKLYGEDIGTQFKFKNCIFDFIHIKNATLYECKLNIKDFKEEQHEKYLSTLGTYNLVYLIGKDCIIDMKKQKIFTTGNMPDVNNVNSRFLQLLSSFEIVILRKIKEYFKMC